MDIPRLPEDKKQKESKSRKKTGLPVFFCYREKDLGILMIKKAFGVACIYVTAGAFFHFFCFSDILNKREKEEKDVRDTLGTRFFPILLILLAGIQLTGCSPGSEKKAEIVEITEVEPVKEIGIRDLQVSIPKSGKHGTLTYSVISAGEKTEGSLSFTDSGTSFEGEDENKIQYYSLLDQLIYKTEDGWKAASDSYMSFWNLVYEKEGKLKEEESWYEIILEGVEDDNPCMKGLLYSLGFELPVFGNSSFDFFIDKETRNILNLEVQVPFLADQNEKTTNGFLNLKFDVEENGDYVIEAPDIEIQTSQQEDTKEFGTLLYGKNLYQNKVMDLQIYGKDQFCFDQEKTEELALQYRESKNAYQEEGYAVGENQILNIVSMKKQDLDAKEALMKYLKDSQAEKIKETGELTIGDGKYVSCSASINGNKTKTYAGDKENRLLFFTLYYQDKAQIADFEKCLFSMSENPLWEPETGSIGDKYTFKTPKNYRISKEDSNAFYLCMETDQDSLNVFIIKDGNMEKEIKRDTENQGEVLREILKEEELLVPDDRSLHYFLVHNVAPDYDYYTYLGFCQEENDVMKLYSVRMDPDEDYQTIYKTILKDMKRMKKDPEEKKTDTEKKEEES